eukprot:g8944.t1
MVGAFRRYDCYLPNGLLVEMPQVQFSPGPFPEQYEDGHPPEKETEDERRRYRYGLTPKGDNLVSIYTFEETIKICKKKQSKRNNKTIKKPADISIIAQGATEETRLDRMLMDLSPYAARSFTIDIPEAVKTAPSESTQFASYESGDDHEGEIKMIHPECRTVPYIVKQLVISVLLLTPLVLFLAW